MINRRALLKCGALLTALTAAPAVSADAPQPIPVVTTFSILGDMVQRIGGDAVAVTTLVGRNGDTHVYQPTPADAKAVKTAAMLFTNGLEFEGWLDRLAEAAQFNGLLVVATDGMPLLATDEHGDDEHANQAHDEDKSQHDDDAAADDAHPHGEYDPHGWLSLQNAIIYVDNITAALARALPPEATRFYQNRARYVAEIETLDQQLKSRFAALPASARTIVTSHDAFQYFGREYGLTFLAPVGLSTDSEASARDVAQLISQIREQGISAVFVENVADNRLVQQIARETGSVIGGKLYPGALSAADGRAATYLELMQHNATTIADALGKANKL